MPKVLLRFLDCAGERSVNRFEQLTGGAISQTVRIFISSGETYVAKFCALAPGDLYEIEADGLQVLRREGCPRVPDAIYVGADFLLLEDLDQSDERAPHYWEDLGRQVAALHQQEHDRLRSGSVWWPISVRRKSPWPGRVNFLPDIAKRI